MKSTEIQTLSLNQINENLYKLLQKYDTLIITIIYCVSVGTILDDIQMICNFMFIEISHKVKRLIWKPF